MSPTRVSLLERAEAWGRRVENALLTLLLAALILLAVGQIVLRNLFSIGFPWVDGVIRVAVLWIAVVGAVAATRERRHITIDVAPRLLPAALIRPVTASVNAFAAAVCGVLAWYAFAFVSEEREFGEVVFGGLPAWIFEVILPIGFALMCYRFALRSLGVAFGVSSPRGPQA